MFLSLKNRIRRNYLFLWLLSSRNIKMKQPWDYKCKHHRGQQEVEKTMVMPEVVGNIRATIWQLYSILYIINLRTCKQTKCEQFTKADKQ